MKRVNNLGTRQASRHTRTVRHIFCTVAKNCVLPMRKSRADTSTTKRRAATKKERANEVRVSGDLVLGSLLDPSHHVDVDDVRHA
jgi:hypothetical protein